mgnify:CR=1 FL=1
MKRITKAARIAASLGAALLLLAASGVVVHTAEAQKKTKSTKTEAKFISYDAESKTMTVKVLKSGKRPENRKLSLKKGKKATFKIKPEGSILMRTSITADGMRSSIDEIPDNKTLNIYWVPDEKDPDVRFARKIDMVYTDQELAERDERRLEEARAKGQVSDD